MAVRTAIRGAQTLSPGLDFGLWRRHGVRLIRQTEVAECGLASLTMIANYHGLDIDIGTMRRRFQSSARGSALKSLTAIADQLNLIPRAIRLPLEGLKGVSTPAILHWNMNHYVVLERVSNGKALIHDPVGTTRWMSLDQMSPHFTGVALELRPAEDFEPQRYRERLKLSQLWQRITGLKRALVQTIVLSIVLEAFVLASPYYMQVAVDSALPALDRDLLTVLALGFALFTIVNAVATFLRSFVLLLAGTTLGYGIATNIARRLFRLPVSWFEKRHIGDILSRFQSITPIQQFLTQSAVSAILDGGFAVLTLAFMFTYSATLTSIALAAFGLYGVVRAISFATQRTAQEEAIVASGREQSVLMESLRGIVTLRLFNRETARHALWQARLTDSMNATVSLARIGIWKSTANNLIFGLETVASVWLAIRLVIDGGFSVGMVFAYLAYKTQFLQRAASLVDQTIALRMLGLHLERLSDIALADKDKSAGEQVNAETRLLGKIELRNVSYRYSPSDPVVLDGVNLVVEPGDHVAITGPSGGGKSTLVKILLGLVEPDEGEILVDDKPIGKFGYRNYREQVSAVLQDDSLFAGSLAENIALFDDAPDMERIVESAERAALHDDIAAMPMAYDTLVGDMGSTLSGGQRQRLLLARALYRQPTILVVDEGTSHLDPAREHQVNAAIEQLGITRIIIAHRMETINTASRVLSVKGGKISNASDR